MTKQNPNFIAYINNIKIISNNHYEPLPPYDILHNDNNNIPTMTAYITKTTQQYEEHLIKYGMRHSDNIKNHAYKLFDKHLLNWKDQLLYNYLITSNKDHTFVEYKQFLKLYNKKPSNNLLLLNIKHNNYLIQEFTKDKLNITKNNYIKNLPNIITKHISKLKNLNFNNDITDKYYNILDKL